jgi:GDP-mannose transporter
MPPLSPSNESKPEIDHSSSNAEDKNDIEDIELAPLVPGKDGDADDTIDLHRDMSTMEWLQLTVKKNGTVLTSIASYSFCSVSMVLVNKSLASSYNSMIVGGDLNISLVVFQAIVAVMAVKACQQLKWIEIPAFSMETAKQWAPVNIFFCSMLFTGMASLKYNSVPMVTIFKNVSNITTSIGDYYLFGNKPEPLVIVAFGVMLSGAVAAAWNDMSLTYAGLVWMALNCISSSGYVLYMKHATDKVKLSKFGMVFYNNALCVFFLLPVAFGMGEIHLLWESKGLHTMDYATKNLFAGLVGFLLNFASLNCVANAGPTTYVTIGSLNKIPVAFMGYWMFDSEISRETWFFILVSMCGGFLYSFAKLQSSSSKRTTRTK